MSEEGSESELSPVRPEAVANAIQEARVTHLVFLPDVEHAETYFEIGKVADLSIVQVNREGEAFGVAAGLWVAGKRPLISIQNTGFFESGDSLRGFAHFAAVPLVMLLSYRGYREDRPITDTAAIYTVPVLHAWGVESELVRGEKDLRKLSEHFEKTDRDRKPRALLVPEDAEHAARKGGQA